jgi:voltage-gated potassium channel
VSSSSPNLRRTLKRLREHRARPGGRILFTRPPFGPEIVLALRGLLVLALFAIVLIVFYVEREGLKDASDGHLSLSDVVYFTMVTVTTVGYGDIVPVSDGARMVDALLVTPIRIFVWFIFVGTAYQLVIQRVIEDWRMHHLQRRLSGHVVICGFGNSGKSAAAEFLGKDVSPEDIVVIDTSQQAVATAVEQGFVGLLGEATSEELLRIAAVDRARGVVVAVSRDDTALMIVVTARGIGSKARIVASVHERENVKLLRNAGADTVVTPWSFSGYLLADGITQLYTVDLVQDALSHGGQLGMNERAPTAAEIGRLARELRYSLVLGIVRNGRRLMFWEDPELRIEPQDQLIVMDARRAEGNA